MKNEKAVFGTRRGFLKLSGAACLAVASPSVIRATELAASVESHDQTAAAMGLLHRLMPRHADQFSLKLSASAAEEHFRVSGATGRILVEASSTSALLAGIHFYLKHVAKVNVSWNGDSLDRLPHLLPAPGEPLTRTASVQHRFALNDTNDGYTGPYWQWERWEHLIDVLALHGINEVLVYMGAEAVYQQCFREFGYSDEELRAWFPTPAHQPWWLLENMSSWVGPSISQQLIDARLELASRITQRLRSLGMIPVLPGYYGIVPDGFEAKCKGAHVVPQGEWLGLKRPDWLDPRTQAFEQVAASFYRVQEKLLGKTSIFKMDPLHEGGRAGDLNVTEAAAQIDAQLQKAHPGAIWAILGWQENPKREVLAGVRDKERMLILDGVDDRYLPVNREEQWDEIPYAFGTIWNFGGHTAMGANLGVWNDLYFKAMHKSNSKLRGIAMMPEASCNNPAAFEFFTELAWTHDRIDMPAWFSAWSEARYGGKDANADAAWQILRETAYNGSNGKWSEPHDNLFSAQPSLSTKTACMWAPEEPRYDLLQFRKAINALLQVAPALRRSAAYHYDLVDVARQTIADNSRLLLPKIRAAFEAREVASFAQLTKEWLAQIDALNAITATESSLLLGVWLADARRWAHSPQEAAQFEFDARSILLEWGPEASRKTGVRDYANREWNGLLLFYRARWQHFFELADLALKSNQPIAETDWFAFDEKWARGSERYPAEARGDAWSVVTASLKQLSL